MADYHITGVWKDTNGTITHFALHPINSQTKTWTTQPTKTSKADTIALVEAKENTITTIVWNYTYGKWYLGSTVFVVAPQGGDKYLKSAPDEKISDNLGHLICWNHFFA